jgi:hypothetical protein
VYFGLFAAFKVADAGSYTQQFAILTGASGVEKGKARPWRLAGTQRLPSLAGMVVVL